MVRKLTNLYGSKGSILPSSICKNLPYPCNLQLIQQSQVQKRPLSFTSARALRAKVELLPGGPQWKSKTIVIPGGATRTPLVLYYRDGLEVFKHIFGNPDFKNSMSFIPQKIYVDHEKETRIYTEIFTGDWAWEAQASRLSDILV